MTARIGRLDGGMLRYPVTFPVAGDRCAYTSEEHPTVTVVTRELEQLETDRDDLLWIAECARRLVDAGCCGDSLELLLLRNALSYVAPSLRLLGEVAL